MARVGRWMTLKEADALRLTAIKARRKAKAEAKAKAKAKKPKLPNTSTSVRTVSGGLPESNRRRH